MSQNPPKRISPGVDIYGNIPDDLNESDYIGQAYTHAQQGCLKCAVWVKDINFNHVQVHPAFVIEERERGALWQCPICKSYYGRVE